MERSFQGVWFPKSIWLSKELTMSEKCLMVEIESLSNNPQGCFASNQHFADFLGFTKETISNIISKLSKKGFITVTLTYKQGSKEIDKRFIRVNDKFKLLQIGLESSDPPHSKVDTPPLKNDDPPHFKVEDNNTLFTNTIETTTTKEPVKEKITKVAEKNKVTSSSFLDNEEYAQLSKATKHNLRKYFKDLSEDKFKDIYVVVLKEFNAGKINNFEAVLFKAIQGSWNFSDSIKPSRKCKGSHDKNYAEIIHSLYNFAVKHRLCGWSNNEILEKFRRDTAKYSKTHATLIEEYSEKINEELQRKLAI